MSGQGFEGQGPAVASRPIKFRFWSGQAMFSESNQVYPCMHQQALFDAGSVNPLAWDHIGKSGAAFLQFTGLKDKTGREIYEGDIVRHPTDGIFRIQWYSDRWEAYQSPCETSFDGRNLFSVHNIMEILGNIYERPNLLKGVGASPEPTHPQEISPSHPILKGPSHE